MVYTSSFEAAAKLKVSRGFSFFHGCLFDLCLGTAYVDPEKLKTLENGGTVLTREDLSSLAQMVKVEFVASMQKELKGSETSDQAKPHPYDVFLMKTTLGGISSRIAVCVPYKRELLWWNGMAGLGALWKLDSESHLRKIANLAGPARVLQSLHDAIPIHGQETLAQWAMKREMLVDVLEGDQFIEDRSMNKSQRKAVATVSSPEFQSGFLCIQGPPGTGKTTTMVGMILASIYTGFDVIVTAPSNAAVANLALKLHSTGRAPFGDICVFGDNCDASVQFLNPQYRSTRYVQFRTKLAKLEEEKLAKFEEEKRAKVLLDDFVSWLHLDKEGEYSIADLGVLCPLIGFDVETDSVTIDGRKEVARLLGDAKVILCTLNSAGSFSLRMAVKRAHFTTLMLDEGGQCTEAEFFIATTFPGIERIVVMGDPKQLRPTVIEPVCEKAGFGESFLGQVYKLHPGKIHLLDTQYRMDPEILRFPNTSFYKGRIKCGQNVLSREPPVERPFLFVDTQGRGQEENIKYSWHNQYEIAAIKILLSNDQDIKTLLNSGDKKATVIIITPYKQQMKLLQERIKLPKPSEARLLISTVDAFQGQEGDIVILSTVRTQKVGFTDNAQRLNVALTRAKRVLRVVGDLRFFESIPGRMSTLRNLAQHARDFGKVEATRIKSLPYCPPDWTITTAWDIAVTQRFYHYIGLMSETRSKNICFNTLFAIATPDLRALKSRIASRAGWQISSLSGHDDLHVVWIARKNGAVQCGTVEAHYAGSRKDCLRFIQENHKPPDGSTAVLSDMSGFDKSSESGAQESGEMHISWKLNNQLQYAILSETIPELPQGMLELDPPQESIAKSPPPLMIESRSGTGKTLVLLQHAAFHHREDENRPGCFITVSPRLKDELKRKYEELRPILFNGLPPTEFFSFWQILFELLKYRQVNDFSDLDRCNFSGYDRSRKSHRSLPIEPQLIENEIGGVIMGSLAAANQHAALNRDQYLQDKRSNVSTKSLDGKERRELIYDEYEHYRAWKKDTGKFDINDVVLRLLQEDMSQVFSSGMSSFRVISFVSSLLLLTIIFLLAYLDEVQDLSHAAVYLICTIAGKDSLHWVCAGDPAQMISPGCSFTFDGLKQTLRAVRPGIESKLKTVHHLVVNYRTTKDILTMANAILAIAKKEFPGAIEYALPEIAKKDLGLRVVMCSWNAAIKTQVKFGENQVLIYSPSDSTKIPSDAKLWLKNHPFILSSLDSKGLEFDDVVIAFDMDRKNWDISRHDEASLRMLRELYVAITRAQRRVVILLKYGDKNMHQFFKELDCEELKAEVIFQEFDRETTSDQWFDRAQQLFQSGQFKLAASCFTRADKHGWSFLAKGEDCLCSGLKDNAIACFRRSVRLFHDRREHKKILDLLKKLVDISLLWDATDDDIFFHALRDLPTYLSREYVVRLTLLRGKWGDVRVSDLMDSSVSSIFEGYRKTGSFKNIIRSSSDDERSKIEASLPWAIADYHSEAGNFLQASRISLQNGDYKSANESTENMLMTTVKNKFDKTKILSVVRLWDMHKVARTSGILRNSKTALFLRLFDSPVRIAASNGNDCLKMFGREVVRLAVENAGLPPTRLLSFSSNEFKSEITGVLETRFKPYLTGVVEWYSDNGYESIAAEFAKARPWSNVDLLRIVLFLRTRPKWLFEKLAERGILKATLEMILLSNHLSDGNKERFVSDFKLFDAKWNPPRPDSSSKTTKKWWIMNMWGLAERRLFVEAAFMFAHVEDVHMAVHFSIAALKIHSSTVVANILRIWEEYSHKGNHFIASTPEARQKLLLYFLNRPQDYRVLVDDDGEVEDNVLESLREAIYSSYSTETDYGSLVKTFGPVAAAYSRVHNGKRHCEDFLQALSSFHSDLKDRLLIQFELVEGTKKKGQRTKKMGKNRKSKAPTEASPSSTSMGNQIERQVPKGQAPHQKQSGRKNRRNNNKKGGKKKKK
jgi:tetratricopeptide (TPR) repeat protein